MRPSCPAVRGNHPGFSLIELIAALAIIGLILAPVAGIINQFIFVPSQLSATTALYREAGAAVRWIEEDARQAETFAATTTSPNYGTFAWTDRTATTITTYSVRYFWSEADTSLMREVTIDGVPQTNLVSANIENYEDVSMQESGLVVSGSVTTTASSLQDTATQNVPVRAHMRPLSPSPQPTPPPFRLAWDDFESGDLTGGTGWEGAWSVSGTASVITDSESFEGASYLRLQNSGAEADRSTDLTGQTSTRVQFWAKTGGFEPADTARFKVSADGAAFTVLKTFTDADVGAPGNNFYLFWDFALPTTATTTEFFIAFDSGMDDAGDTLFVDDLKVVKTWH